MLDSYISENRILFCIDDTKQNPIFWLIIERRTTHVESSVNSVIISCVTKEIRLQL